MIYIEIKGGLGNQMFQYAAARRLAAVKHTDVECFLPYFNKTEDRKPLLLTNYCCTIKECKKRFDLLWKKKPISQLANLKYKFFDGISIIYESRAAFNDNILTLPENNIFLTGYWNSEKYFKDIESIIRNEFTLKKPLSETSQIWLEKIQASKQSVALHIRRGDYITSDINKKIYAVVPKGYYYSCVNTLKEQYKDLEIFVFSNDISWCEENFDFDIPVHYVTGNDEAHGHEDMYLMSFCDHNVIANSSFSWWGAWLNNNSDKKVFYPEKYFNFKDRWHDSSDFYPEDWIKV